MPFVYLTDALFLPTEVDLQLFPDEDVKVRFGPAREREFALPRAILEFPAHFDAAIQVAVAIAQRFAANDRDPAPAVRNSLKREMCAEIGSDLLARLSESVLEFVRSLAELIRRRDDSIWGFVILNGYRPALLRGKFDLILGNPPWLSYRYITDPDYQDEVKRRAVVEYQIAPKDKKLFT